MAITESTSEGWFSRLWESIKGVIVGIILFLIAFPLLFWNEGRAVHRAKGLEAGKGQVVSASDARVDPANEGKLVHMTGTATTDGTLSDAIFSVEAPKALRLQREVEMYQWKQNEKKEKRKKLGGGEETTTTYTYEQVWDDQLLNSGSYKEADKKNPDRMPYESETWNAPDVKLGAFTLGDLTKQVNAWTTVKVDSGGTTSLKPSNNTLFSGNPDSPKIGDVRVSFKSVEPSTVSILAVQRSSGFEHFDSGQGDEGIYDLVMGQQTSQQMFAALESQNTMLTWILRLVGFIFMVVGISLVFRPLVVVADVVPIFGTLLESGLGFLAFTLAMPFTLITIAIGWIAYRPLLGVGLLLVAGGIGFFAYKTAKGRKAG